jgi:hypothetical protein
MAYTTIDDPSAHFQTITYSGNGASRSITNTGNSDLKPDLVWIKERNNAVSHRIFDSSRGATKRMFSNNNDAESTQSNSLTAFNTDGFSLGDGTSVNGNSDTYVAWQWKANEGTTSSNTDGGITSTVQANTTAGFSVVTFTSNGSNGQTVGHGLGVAPTMIITKNRSATGSWYTYNYNIGANHWIRLNDTDAKTSNTNVWGNTHPTSSVFTIGLSDLGYSNTNNIVAYCFAEIKGYSKFGSYTGNGTGSFGPFANGPFVYTGFKPAWVMIKRTDGANGWTIFDSVRDPHNVVGNQLSANSNSAEEADASHHSERDYYSNGFKLKGNGNDVNANGANYIYMAFAEHPFVSSKGVPVTAR